MTTSNPTQPVLTSKKPVYKNKLLLISIAAIMLVIGIFASRVVLKKHDPNAHPNLAVARQAEAADEKQPHISSAGITTPVDLMERFVQKFPKAMNYVSEGARAVCSGPMIVITLSTDIAHCRAVVVYYKSTAGLETRAGFESYGAFWVMEDMS